MALRSRRAQRPAARESPARGLAPAAALDPCPGSDAQVGSPCWSGVPGSRYCAGDPEHCSFLGRAPRGAPLLRRPPACASPARGSGRRGPPLRLPLNWIRLYCPCRTGAPSLTRASLFSAASRLPIRLGPDLARPSPPGVAAFGLGGKACHC